MSNEPYIVSARKYRPATFKTVVGQRALTNTLKNAISTGRVAQAYLFCGPRGVGKTSCARIFAKTINCLHPTADGEACGECENCVAVDRGASYNVIELDAASNNGVEQMRNLTEQVQVPPQLGKYRVFIIDEVHMLSSGAFNAFLKTLEEPPAYAVFILATTEKHKVLPTILSRCQIYDFKRITVNDMAEHLAYVAEREGVKADTAALNVIARKADGAMRDALSIFDQVSASSEGNITYESTIANLNVLDYDYYFRLVDAFRDGDVGKSLMLYKEIRDLGFDSLFFINGLAEHVRDLMVAADARTLPLLETADDVAAKYKEQAQSLPVEWYYTALRLLNDCDRDYRLSSGKRLLVELTLIRLCQLLKPATPPFDAVDYLPPLQNPVQAPRQSTVKDSSDNKSVATPLPVAESERVSDSKDVAGSAQTPPFAGVAAGTGRVHRGRRAPSTISISQSARQFDAQQYSLQPKSEPYTAEDVARYWRQYIEQHPQQHLLITAMRAGAPQNVGDNEWLAVVDNEAQAQAFEDHAKELIPFLRESLRNDGFCLKTKLNEASARPRTLTRKELLAKIVNDNPVLGEALKEFDFEITN